jgi:hypothetical protein
MFLPFFNKQREIPARDERDADTDGDRDLVALVNEARTQQDLNSALQIARMRRRS